jgi:hypothetical protein
MPSASSNWRMRWSVLCTLRAVVLRMRPLGVALITFVIVVCLICSTAGTRTLPATIVLSSD